MAICNDFKNILKCWFSKVFNLYHEIKMFKSKVHDILKDERFEVARTRKCAECGSHSTPPLEAEFG